MGSQGFPGGPGPVPGPGLSSSIYQHAQSSYPSHNNGTSFATTNSKLPATPCFTSSCTTRVWHIFLTLCSHLNSPLCVVPCIIIQYPPPPPPCVPSTGADQYQQHPYMPNSNQMNSTANIQFDDLSQYTAQMSSPYPTQPSLYNHHIQQSPNMSTMFNQNHQHQHQQHQQRPSAHTTFPINYSGPDLGAIRSAHHPNVEADINCRPESGMWCTT